MQSLGVWAQMQTKPSIAQHPGSASIIQACSIPPSNDLTLILFVGVSMLVVAAAQAARSRDHESPTVTAQRTQKY